MSNPRAEMRVERLPFTVYDVIGYLVPGVFALWIGLVFFKKLNGTAIIDSQVLNIVGQTPESIYFALFIFVIAAYAVGHLMGLMSSITVEKIAVEYFGYPSRFLTISNADECRSIIISNMLSSSFHRKRVFLAKLFCWPIWIFVRLMITTGLFTIFMKPFPEHVIDKLKNKLNSLQLEAGPIDNCDWWKGAEFYVINNIPHAFARMYNYLTIFGFFRNFSFIFIIISSMYMYKFLKLSPHPWHLLASLLERSWGSVTFTGKVPQI